MSELVFKETLTGKKSEFLNSLNQYKREQVGNYQGLVLLSSIIIVWVALALVIPYKASGLNLKEIPTGYGWIEQLIFSLKTKHQVFLYSLKAIRLYVFPLIVTFATAFAGGLAFMFAGAELGRLKVGPINVSGWLAKLVNLILDVLESLPAFVVALLVDGLMANRSLTIVALVLGALGSARVARLLLLQIKLLKKRDFIDCALASGIGWPRIILVHILYKLSFPVLIQQALYLTTQLILLEIAITFIAEIKWAPCFTYTSELPTWGKLISDGLTRGDLWWITAWMMLPLVFLLWSLNQIAEKITQIGARTQ